MRSERRHTASEHPTFPPALGVVWSVMVVSMSTGCTGASRAPIDGGACQTPAGQLEDWQPTFDGGFQDDAGTANGAGDLPGERGPDDAVADGGASSRDGGAVPPPADGGSSNVAHGAAPVQKDVTGEALTFLYNQSQQAREEPDTLSVLVTAAPSSNGRFCETCHPADSGWQLTPAFAAFVFGGYNGVLPSNSSAPSNDQLDPLFRTVDGATAPTADVSTPEAREIAYRLLLGKALIRVGLPMPAGSEFAMTAVDDPYGHASAKELSLFRRPLPMMNLRFLTTVMWDGRFTRPCQPLLTDLIDQAYDAATTHAQAREQLSPHAAQMMVDRERIIYFAQSSDNAAGALDADGARGGPINLQREASYFGINAFPGPDPRGVPYSSNAFTIFDAWSTLSGSDPRTSARLAIARGQALFNNRAFTIADVRGFNDERGLASIVGTCTTCHNAPNVGNNSLGLLMDIGISDASRRSPDLPLYAFTNLATGQTMQVTDPGRGLVTGSWKDIGRFKVPTLRGLAFRAPYFHDGSSATLADAIDVHDARFAIGLTEDEKDDLTAFLSAL
jgi:cytochrome c peroxidase